MYGKIVDFYEIPFNHGGGGRGPPGFTFIQSRRSSRGKTVKELGFNAPLEVASRNNSVGLSPSYSYSYFLSS